MVRRPHNNPFVDPLGEEESPVIDPAFIYQKDPEINFDNLKENQSQGPEETEIPATEKQACESGKSGQSKSILEKLRQARGEHAAPTVEKVEPVSCPNCAEADKARLLALADMENARKRLAREKEDFVKFAGESILADILPALDNIDLALAYAPEGKECRNFVIGVDMTRKLLLDALAKHGLEAIGELGEPFDPAKHEAVEMQSNPGFKTGQICGLMNKGYRLKERLIRPARVTVCKND